VRWLHRCCSFVNILVYRCHCFICGSGWDIWWSCYSCRFSLVWPEFNSQWVINGVRNGIH